MDDILDPAGHAAQEAARALRMMGWPVLACEDGEGAWRIRDAILTHDELVEFAFWAPTPTSDGSTSSASAQTPPDLQAPLDATEALECIRAVADVVVSPTANDEAVALRMIRAIIRKAPHSGANKP